MTAFFPRQLTITEVPKDSNVVGVKNFSAFVKATNGGHMVAQVMNGSSQFYEIRCVHEWIEVHNHVCNSKKDLALIFFVAPKGNVN